MGNDIKFYDSEYGTYMIIKNLNCKLVAVVEN